MQYQEIDGSKSISISNEEDVDEDVFWEKKLPNDYQDYILISDRDLCFNSKKEFYYLFCAGFLCYNGGLVEFMRNKPLNFNYFKYFLHS